jgi:hypothetical protein
MSDQPTLVPVPVPVEPAAPAPLPAELIQADPGIMVDSIRGSGAPAETRQR